VIDKNSYLVNPNLYECESHEFVSDKPLVENIVDPILLSFDHIYPIESEFHTAQVLLVSSDSKELGGNPPIPTI